MTHRSHTKRLLLISLAVGSVAACGKVSKTDTTDGNDSDSDSAISTGGLEGDDEGSGGTVSTGGTDPTGGTDSTGGGASDDGGSGGEESCDGDCDPEPLGGAGSACEGDDCLEPTCVPDCDEKVCGTDGCDGSCGSCLEDMTCTEAQRCEPEPGTRPETEMSSIAGGTFVMGAEDLDSMSSPAHERAVAPFSIDRTEVTARAYDACIAAGACEAVENEGGPGQNSGSTDFLDFPVNYVTFEQSTQFCAWMGKRLPTETEWEYAAGGALGYLYPWGNDEPFWQACSPATFNGEVPEFFESIETDYDHGCAVGGFPAGAHDLYDMAGGVWEFVDAPWCAYSSETESGYFEGNNALITCAEGPVLRGSAFTTAQNLDSVRVSYREQGSGIAANGHQATGFRCAKSD